jgi:hypothetical protein
MCLVWPEKHEGGRNSTIFSPDLETETANLRTDGEVPSRFLAPGCRGRRGEAPGAFNSARGSLEWRRHGRELTVVVSVVHREEKGEGKKSGGARGGRVGKALGFGASGVALREGKREGGRGG